VKILVAEDVALMRKLITDALRALGHDVTAVADGDAAWAAFTREPPDILLLDWFMPGADGLEVCRRVRASEAGRDAFVLMLTGRDEAEDLVAALEAGVDDYITKPVSSQHLFARLAIAERGIARRAAQRAVEEELRKARWTSGVLETTLAMQHEINNPLGALTMTLELELRGLEPGDLHDSLRVALGQAYRIADIVKRMSKLREPRSVEYLPGVMMLDVHATRADDEGRGAA
jgi:DNA-binding response OmpR family regulator